MPKRFRSFKRRKFGRRRSFKGRRKYRKGGMVRMIRSVASRTGELKWQAGTVVTRPDTSGFLGPSGYPMNAMLKNVNRATRIGNQIVNQFLQVTLAYQTGNVLISQRIRFMVVLDRQNNQANPGVALNPYFQLFADPSVGGWHYSTFNNDFVGKTKRYKIIKDVKMMCNVQGGANNIATKYVKTFKIKLRSRTDYADTNVGDVTDIMKNALWIFFFSDQATPADAPIIGVEWKFMFRDS